MKPGEILQAFAEFYKALNSNMVTCTDDKELV